MSISTLEPGDNTAIEPPTPERSRLSRPAVTAISLLTLAIVCGVVMFAALRSPLKDDIAWLLYVARRWLAGRALYVDVIEVNPPLIVWLSAVPLSLSRWLDTGQQYVALPFFTGIVLACAWFSACLLRGRWGGGGERGLFAARAPVFAVIGGVLLTVPAADLGQREHLLVAAFLPYLVLFARALTRDGPRASPITSLAAGILAGLGCALKPQYGIAFAALEAVALCHGLRPWRVAPMAAAVTLAGYVALVAWLCPAYLRRAVPMAMALYGATDVPFRALFLDSVSLLAAEAAVLFLWWRDRHVLRQGPLLVTGIVFSAASSLVCFMDGKDWFYHRLPATVVTVLMLVLWAAAAVTARPRGRLPRRAVTLAVGAVALFFVSAVQRLEPSVQQAVEPKVTTVARLEALIRLHNARTYIAFSEWIALGFPVVNNTGVVWASRFDSMWALKGEVWRAKTDPGAAKEWPVARWVAHDFIAACPDIAVVDTRESLNYIGVLSASETSFDRVWSRYKPLVAFDGLVVYKRGKGGCIDPWVAADAVVGGTAIR